MDWDFSRHEILGTLASSRREKLFRWLQEHVSVHMTIRRAGGELPTAKRKDWDYIILLAFDSDNRIMYTLADKPKTEIGEIFFVGQMPFFDVEETVKGHIITKRKESTGRPPKYGEVEAGKVYRMRQKGKTIRAIASEMGMSTTTVQVILKRINN